VPSRLRNPWGVEWEDVERFVGVNEVVARFLGKFGDGLGEKGRRGNESKRRGAERWLR